MPSPAPPGVPDHLGSLVGTGLGRQRAALLERSWTEQTPLRLVRAWSCTLSINPAPSCRSPLLKAVTDQKPFFATGWQGAQPSFSQTSPMDPNSMQDVHSSNMTQQHSVAQRLQEIVLHGCRTPLALPLGLALSASNIDQWCDIFDSTRECDARDADLLHIFAWWFFEYSSKQPDVHYTFSKDIQDYLFCIDTSEVQYAWALPRVLKAATTILDLKDLCSDNEEISRMELFFWLYREHSQLVLETPQLLRKALDNAPAYSVYPIPNIIYIYWFNRPDLRGQFDISTADGYFRLLYWLFTNTHGNLLDCAAKKLALDQAPVDTIYPMPHIIYSFWLNRPDLREQFDISTADGYFRLLYWLFTNTHGNLLDYAAKKLALDQVPVDTVYPMLLIVYVFWLNRPDLQEQFDITTDDGFFHLLRWLFIEPSDESLLANVAEGLARQRSSLRLPGKDKIPSQEESEAAIPLVLAVAWKTRSDLQASFPDTPSGHQGLLAWAKSPDEAYLRRFLNIDQPRPDVLGAEAAQTLRNGVNVLGFLTTGTGLGEDARMAITAARAAGIPAVGGDIPQAGRILDARFADCLVETMPYGTSLVYTAAPYIVSTYNSMPSSWWYGMTNIVSVAWELPTFPPHLAHTLDYADMIWAPSRFIQNALGLAFDRDLLYMPLPVSLPALSERHDRAFFGIPKDCFIFSYVFDFASGFARKNPQAAVEAFQRAFPLDDYSVRLYLKFPPVSKDNPFFRQLRERIDNDARIVLIGAKMTREEILAFIACCDAYVSPHRSEGFGRTIAEAMLLKRPVIVSAYSGNVDFTTPSTAYCIGGKLVDVAPGTYPLWEGQQWFEPDREELAAAMRRCRDTPDEGKRKALAGETLLREQFSPTAIGQRYRIVLETAFGMRFF